MRELVHMIQGITVSFWMPVIANFPADPADVADLTDLPDLTDLARLTDLNRHIQMTRSTIRGVD